jgi:hypothetical protein
LNVTASAFFEGRIHIHLGKAADLPAYLRAHRSVWTDETYDYRHPVTAQQVRHIAHA